MSKLTLTIDGEDDAILHDPRVETVRILRDVAAKVNSGTNGGSIYDAKGAKVGSWRLYIPEQEVDSDKQKKVAPGYEPNEESVENVLRINSLAVANADGKSFETIASEVFESLDFFLIKKAALYGDRLDVQIDYANNEIARQLREMGILEPLKPTDAPSPRG